VFSRWPIYRRVLANLDDDRAIDGVLIAQRGPLLVLSDANLLTPGHEPQPMDGQVFIERARVLFLQASNRR
jgi:hypothetical protein